jgi:hypothetical protein
MSADDSLRANYYCAAAEIRRRIRTGQPIPDWLRRHHENLNTAIRSAAHTRQASEPDLGDLVEEIGTADVAALLGLPRRTVQRLAPELGAVLVGKSLVYRRSVVERYMKGEHE